MRQSVAIAVQSANVTQSHINPGWDGSFYGGICPVRVRFHPTDEISEFCSNRKNVKTC